MDGLLALRLCRLLLSFGSLDAGRVGLQRGSPLHPATLVRTALIVDRQVRIQRDLHLIDRLEPGPAAFHPEVLVQQSATQAFDDAVALRAFHLGAAVLDPFQLQDQRIHPVKTL